MRTEVDFEAALRPAFEKASDEAIRVLDKGFYNGQPINVFLPGTKNWLVSFRHDGYVERKLFGHPWPSDEFFLSTWFDGILRTRVNCASRTAVEEVLKDFAAMGPKVMTSKFFRLIEAVAEFRGTMDALRDHVNLAQIAQVMES